MNTSTSSATEVTCRGSMALGTGCGTCSKCIKEKGNLEFLQKMKNLEEKDFKNCGMQGWICPNCGAGNSPYSNRCNCVPPPIPQITC